MWNPGNPTRSDHPGHKLANVLFHNPWDDLEVAGAGGSEAWKGAAWEEIDRAVLKEWIRKESEAIDNIKWKFHMGMDAQTKIG